MNSPDTKRSSQEIRQSLAALDPKIEALSRAFERNQQTIDELQRREQKKSPEEMTVDQARAEYIAEYKRCRSAMQKEALIKKTKNSIFKILGSKATKEKIAREEEFYTEELKNLKESYDKARIQMGNAMYEEKKRELQKAGLDGEDLQNALTQYKALEILSKTIIEERQKLIDAKAEGAPIKPALWKRAIDAYTSIKPRWKRVAISTILFLPVTAAVGSAAPIIATYGIAGLATIKFVKSMTLGAISSQVTHGIDAIKSKADKNFELKQGDQRELLKKDFSEGQITLEEYEKKDASLEAEEKKRVRNRMLLKASVSIAVGGMAGMAVTGEMHNLMSGMHRAPELEPVNGHVAEITDRSVLKPDTLVNHAPELEPVNDHVAEIADRSVLKSDTLINHTPAPQHPTEPLTKDVPTTEKPNVVHEKPTIHATRHHLKTHHAEKSPEHDDQLKKPETAAKDEQETRWNPHMNEHTDTDQALRDRQVDPNNVNTNPPPSGDLDHSNPDNINQDGVNPDDQYIGDQDMGGSSGTESLHHDIADPMTGDNSETITGSTTPAISLETQTPITQDAIDNYEPPVFIGGVAHHIGGGISAQIPDPQNISGGEIAVQHIQALHNLETHNDVVESLGHRDVIIERPASTTIQGISHEDFNKAYDYKVIQQEKMVFSSYHQYEKDRLLQQLFGHAKGKIEYNKTLDKNTFGIRMTYYRDDAPTWESTNRIPAKYFFGGNTRELLADPNVSKADLAVLEKAGVLNKNHEFINQKELLTISKAYARFDPNNAKPIGNESIEKYIARLTRDMHQAKDGTYFIAKQGVDINELLRPQAQGAIQDVSVGGGSYEGNGFTTPVPLTNYDNGWNVNIAGRAVRRIMTGIISRRWGR